MKTEVAILGGGLSGLAVGARLVREGCDVAVLEAGREVGGLARTVAMGPYRFDLGGHRFHSALPEVIQWFRDLMRDELLEVSRSSRILMNGRFVDYPLQFPNALTAFGALRSVHVLASSIVSRFRPPRCRNGLGSFEDWVIDRFGKALYEIYFRPYTEKVWGMDCAELSADWANQRIRVPSLLTTVTGSIIRLGAPSQALVRRFLYPRGGIGRLPERMRDRIVTDGSGRVLTGHRVTGLRRNGNAWRVETSASGAGAEIEADVVVSTIPVGRLLAMLAGNGAPEWCARELPYRSVVCIFLAIEGDRVSPDTWTYFPDPALLFGRTHEPINWSPSLAPPGSTSLCVEIFCTEDDSVWRLSDDALMERTLQDLASTGFLASGRVRSHAVVRVPDAYPVYRVDYGKSLKKLDEATRRWPNLFLCGRTGSFRYLNMDGVMQEAITAAPRIAEMVRGPAAPGSTGHG